MPKNQSSAKKEIVIKPAKTKRVIKSLNFRPGCGGGNLVVLSILFPQNFTFSGKSPLSLACDKTRKYRSA